MFPTSSAAWLSLFLLVSTSQAAQPAKRSYSSHHYYVLEHDPSSTVSINECTSALGVELVEQVGELANHWLVRTPKSALSGRSISGNHIVKRVESFKRSSPDRHNAVRSFMHQIPRQRIKKRAPPPIPPPPKTSPAEVLANRLGIKDPTFPAQWHLHNEDFAPNDLNVTGLWEAGITGRGVVSAIVDDGLDFKSDDLAANFDAAGSWDYNDHVPEPLPRLSDDRHGTRCAGEIAAAKNDVCGVGVAYDSKIAGIRILSGPISDADEAAALNYGYQNTSIYSCSWGPPDDGRSMEAPGYLIEKAVLNGIQNGRGGKGSIFVFASGNGAGSDDQCNFDGYTNSIYSVTVAAVDCKGHHPYYSEACAANMIVAYSSGGGNNIHTTDVGKSTCTVSHGGTSAAAPLAAGVIALALQARPELTWRDVQHISVRSALKIAPTDPDWQTTASGRPYSYKYGYGSIDAYQFVTAAQKWQLVKPQTWMDIGPISAGPGVINMTAWDALKGGVFIPPSGGIKGKTTVTKKMLAANNFDKVEHITVKVWIAHARRGDVEVEIVSPKGVKSILAAKRQWDDAKTGFPGWRFMTVKHWDEDPVGDWTIRVSDQGQADKNGSFIGWSMTFWGSSVDASKAKPFVLPVPPSSSSAASPTQTALSSSIRPKPTAHLPSDHSEKPGETHKPSLGQVDSSKNNGTAPSPSPSMSPTPDEGYFSHMGDLVSSQTWLIGAFGAVILFGSAAGLFFWRRRQALRKGGGGDYALAEGDDVAMSSIDPSTARLLGRSSTGRTKELYDAFGEVSDSEDDDDHTAMPGGMQSTTSLRYHDAFLEDDDPLSAPLYRDEPTEADRQRETTRAPGGSRGPSSPGSGDGSWEHASDVPAIQ